MFFGKAESDVVKQIKKSIKTGKKLPDIHVGHLMYESGWAPGVQFPIVIKRSPKSNDEQQTLFADSQYKYWGVLSFRGIYPNSVQEILEFHQGRGNMENYIREGKITQAFSLSEAQCQQSLWAFGNGGAQFIALGIYNDEPR